MFYSKKVKFIGNRRFDGLVLVSVSASVLDFL